MGIDHSNSGCGGLAPPAQLSCSCGAGVNARALRRSKLALRTAASPLPTRAAPGASPVPVVYIRFAYFTPRIQAGCACRHCRIPYSRCAQLVHVSCDVCQPQRVRGRGRQSVAGAAAAGGPPPAAEHAVTLTPCQCSTSLGIPVRRVYGPAGRIRLKRIAANGSERRHSHALSVHQKVPPARALEVAVLTPRLPRERLQSARQKLVCVRWLQGAWHQLLECRCVPLPRPDAHSEACTHGRSSSGQFRPA